MAGINKKNIKKKRTVGARPAADPKPGGKVSKGRVASKVRGAQSDSPQNGRAKAAAPTKKQKVRSSSQTAVAGEPKIDTIYNNVIEILRKRAKRDFNPYKRGTVTRRIDRRMGLNQIGSHEEYLEFLEKDPKEAEALSRDLLIGVTRFFRDKEAHQALQKEIIHDQCRSVTEDTPLRIWVPGCATGEEAYSLAILFYETLHRHDKLSCTVQIFATDIDRDALETARRGVYPISIRRDVSKTRLKRFFEKVEDGYRVVKAIRDTVIFAEHNVIEDPPFSRLHMISCRNLLIYINVEVKNRLMALFHFALLPEGYLFLGTAENVGKHDELFRAVNTKWRLYQKVQSERQPLIEYRMAKIDPSLRVGIRERRGSVNFRQVAEQMILEHYAPCGVFVNHRYDVLHFMGNARRHLQLPTGEPSHNLLDLAPQKMRNKLRALLHNASKINGKTVSILADPGENGETGKRRVKVTARRVNLEMMPREFYSIVFEELSAEAHPGALPAQDPFTADDIVRQLESELKSSREEMESMIEQLETANEELKASNEEMMSMNEEFQSTNEELETSKTELQSLNEELAATNNQLAVKVAELAALASDLDNLLTSTDIGTVFLDFSLRIKRFTPAITRLLPLIDADIGRPLADFVSNLMDEKIIEDARQVLGKLIPIEREVKTRGGDWFMRRILPYRTKDHRIGGLVITYVDITERKARDEYRARLAAVVETTNDAVIGKTLEGIITMWNPGAVAMFGHTAEEAIGKAMTLIIPPSLRDDEKRILETIRRGERVLPFETTRMRKDGSIIDVQVSVSPILDGDGNVIGASNTSMDITERKRAESKLHVARAHLEAMDEALPLGRWICNAGGENVYVTKPFLEMVGLSMQEVLGFGWLHLVPEKERESLRDAWLRCVATGDNWDYEYRIQAQDGSLRNILTFGRPIRDPDGEIMQWVGYHLDITDRKRMEQELKELNENLEQRVKDRTAEAFERWNQLRKLTLELAQTEQRERRRLAQMIHDNLQQLLVAAKMRVHRLQMKSEGEIKPIADEVNDLLDLSVHTARTLTVELSPPVLFHGNLRESLEWVAEWKREKYGLELHMDIDPAAEAPGESVKIFMFEAARELLFNVVKHSGVKEAWLVLREDEDNLMLTIRDKGAGCENKFADPQFASHDGFGLWSLKERTGLLGGQLTVECAPNQGFKVLLSFPRQIAMSDKKQPAVWTGGEGEETEAAECHSKTEGVLRILIVDDHEIVREGLVTLLSDQEDMTVVGEAHNGQEAVSLTERLRPELVIMDVNMSGMNGIEATRIIKDRFPDTCVIGLSINDDQNTMAAMIEAGASSYVTKSDSSRQLHRVIQGVMARKQV